MELIAVIFQIMLEALAEARPRILAGALIVIGCLLLALGYMTFGTLVLSFGLLILLFIKPV